MVRKILWWITAALATVWFFSVLTTDWLVVQAVYAHTIPADTFLSVMVVSSAWLLMYAGLALWETKKS